MKVFEQGILGSVTNFGTSEIESLEMESKDLSASQILREIISYSQDPNRLGNEKLCYSEPTKSTILTVSVTLDHKFEKKIQPWEKAKINQNSEPAKMSKGTFLWLWAH